MAREHRCGLGCEHSFDERMALLEAMDDEPHPASDSQAENPYLRALVTVAERVMTFGGFQRGEFYVSRDNVIRCIDEELEAAVTAAKRRHQRPPAPDEQQSPPRGL